MRRLGLACEAAGKILGFEAAFSAVSRQAGMRRSHLALFPGEVCRAAKKLDERRKKRLQNF
jgi:hypothetical protein